MSNFGNAYSKIQNKFENKIFTKGENIERNDDYSLDIGYGNCRFDDVPPKARTKDFFIHAFTDRDVNKFIECNIDKFDKQFFKDLITSNPYSIAFSDSNCFNIMPMEYIDEELCSLALLHGTRSYSYDGWLKTMMEKYLDILSKFEDIWKAAVRLYAFSLRTLIANTPNEFKDETYYLELLSPYYNYEMAIAKKPETLNLVPADMINVPFLLKVIEYGSDVTWLDPYINVSSFNENAFNLICDDKPLWKYLINKDATIIKYIPLNDERIDYFKSRVDKDTTAYITYFKDKYKKYIREHKPSYSEVVKNERNRLEMNYLGAMINAMNGQSIDNYLNSYDPVRNNDSANTSLLPIKSRVNVPKHLSKTYDSEEYLEHMYREAGITILDEYDSLFFNVVLPDKWRIEKDGYWNDVIDETGTVRFHFFYDSKFYDRDAFVNKIA